MKLNALKKNLLLALSCVLLVITYADKPEQLAIVAVSPDRGTAVVRYSDKSIKLVSIGDEIPETDLELLQVLENRVIAEYKDSEKNTHQEIDEIWVYKAKNNSKYSEVKYVKNFEEQQQTIEDLVEDVSIDVLIEETDSK